MPRMSRLTCSGCGANLPAANPGSIVRCEYCGAQIQIGPGSLTRLIQAVQAQQQLQQDPRVLAAMAAGAGVHKASRMMVYVIVGVSLVATVVPAIIIATTVMRATRAAQATMPSAPPPSPPPPPPPVVEPPAPRLLRPADLAALPPRAFAAIDTTGMIGTLDKFDPIANAPWAQWIASAWSPDAQLEGLHLRGVRIDGTLDATGESEKGQADYRFISKARRTQYAEVRTVSDQEIPASLRIFFAEGQVKVMVLVESTEWPVKGEAYVPTCPLADVVLKLRKEGMVQRPRWDFNMTQRRAGWAWRPDLNDPGTSAEVDATSCKVRR
jgi:hypothetical protein